MQESIYTYILLKIKKITDLNKPLTLSTHFFCLHHLKNLSKFRIFSCSNNNTLREKPEKFIYIQMESLITKEEK